MSYKVYKTTNIVNGKYYIGVHKCNAHLCKTRCNYLGSGNAIKNAIKKYGKENFFKETIKEFGDYESAYLFEAKMVKDEQVRDSMCYNLCLGGGATPETLPQNKECDINGVKYKSISHASIELNTYPKAISDYINFGKELPKSTTKDCTIDGIYFNSYSEAASYFNTNRYTIKRWIKNNNGYSKNKCTKRAAKKVTIDSIAFNSYREACDYYGVSLRTLKSWLNYDSKSKKVNRTGLKKPVIIDDIEFESISSASKYFNVTSTTIINWRDNNNGIPLTKKLSR